MKIGKIFAVALLGLTAVSAISVASSFAPEDESELKSYQAQFEMYNNKKMYAEAKDCLKWISDYKSEDYSVLKEYIEYCKNHDFSKECYSACQRAQELKPDDYEVVTDIIDYLMDKKSKEIYDYLHKEMKVFSEDEHPDEHAELQAKYDEIRGDIRKVNGRYTEVSGWNDTYTFARDDSVYYVIGQDGDVIADSDTQIYSYSPKEKLLAVENEGQLVYTATNGNRKRVPYDAKNEELLNYEYLGPFVSGGANIRVSENEWYYASYSNESIKLITDAFQEASPFWNRIGAVKEDGKWRFIGYEYTEDGTPWRSEQTYADVFRDEYGNAIFNGMSYVKKDGSDKWSLVRIVLPEESGTPSVNEIAADAYTEVKPFSDYGVAKTSDGKWSVIDKEGAVKLATDYKELSPEGCGLVGFCSTDKWGFLDLDGKVIIEPSYDEVTSFNSSGTAFVRVSEQWRAVRLMEYIYKEDN